jgi:hypothetical protein
MAGLDQRGIGPGIEPGHAAAHQPHGQLAAFEIDPLDVGDREFAARRRSMTWRYEHLVS